jgi:arylsulfatase A-like enzyme
MMSSLLLASLLSGVTAAAPAAPAAARCSDCNVLWIVLDTTRADHVGCFGGDPKTAPNVDKVCAGGLSFQNNYAQAPATMLSVASYFSGRYRNSTGIDFMLWEDEGFHAMSDEITTLAEALKGNGFRTVGVSANPMITSRVTQKRSNFDLNYYQGFESFDHWNDGRIAADAPKTLASLKDERFFFYVHAMGPHHPNKKRPGFEKRQGGGWSPGLFDAEGKTDYTAINKGELAVSEEQGNYLRALYDDDIWWADDTIVGPLLAKLEALGLKDKTLVVISSDHGEALGEPHELGQGSKGGHSPYWGHSHASLVAETLHVPLVFRGPGIPKGKRVTDSLSENVDVAPTVVDYLGLKQDPAWGWDGAPLFGPAGVAGTSAISDRGSMKGQRSSARDLNVAVEIRPAWHMRMFYFDQSDFGIRKDTAKTPAHARLEDVLLTYYNTIHPPGAVQTMAGPEGELLDELKALGYMGE